MNYGYDEYCEGWIPRRKRKLAEALSPIVHEYVDEYGMRPYIEVDQLYRGVRLRRLTHLTDEQCHELIARCDRAYEQVMGLTVATS